MIAPKLRFSEFKDEFKTYQIRDIAKIYVGRDLVESSYSPIKTERHIYPVYSNSVDNQGLYGFYDFEEHKFDDNALTVVGRGIGLGTAFYRIGAFGTIGRLLCLTPINQMFHPKYLADYINDKVVIHHESGGIPQLPRSSLENYHVILPTFKEQTKIAEFLSAVDDKISQLSRQLELLKQYKKGVMQKIFSQEIRFKNDNGEDFGEWETDSIENVFTNKSKKFNPVKNKELPCIELEHLSQDTGMILGTISSLNQKSIKNYFKTGDILYGKLRPYLRKFARPNFDGVCSTEIWVLDGIKVSNGYLFQFVQSEQFSELTNIQSGSKMPRAEWSIISNSEIEFPTKPEQKKIAEFLTAIDERIDHTTAQLTHTKQWKKGLLQQMFV